MMHPAQLFWRLLVGFLLLSLGLTAGARPIDETPTDEPAPLKPYKYDASTRMFLDDGLKHVFQFDKTNGVAQWNGVDWQASGTTRTSLSVPGHVEYQGKTYTVTSILVTNSPKDLVTLRLPDEIYYIEAKAFEHLQALDSLYVGRGLISIDVTSFGSLHNSHKPSYIELTSPKAPSVVTSETLDHSNVVITVPKGSLDSYARLQPYFTIIEDGAYVGLRVYVDKPGYLAARLGETGVRYREFNALTVLGSLNERDWEVLMSELPNLISLDLSYADLNFTTITNTNNLGCKCRGLKNLSLPVGVRKIDNDYFQDLSHLEKVDFPSTLKTIGGSAFQNCPRLASITFPSGSLRTIGNHAFMGCKGSAHLKIPEGVETIEGNAFARWPMLESIEFPSTLRFCEQAFTAQDNLSSIVMHSVVPPTMVSSTALIPPFHSNGIGPDEAVNAAYERVNLSVPEVSRSMYGESRGWSKFAHVSTHSEYPDSAYVANPVTFRLDGPVDYRPHLLLEHSSTAQALVPADAAIHLQSLDATYTMDSNTLSATRKSSSLLVEGSLTSDAINIALECNGKSWEYVTLPYNVRVSDLKPRDPAVNLVVMAYDGYERSQDMTRYSCSWRQLGPDDVMEAYRGYAICAAKPTADTSPMKLIIDIPAFDGTTAQNMGRNDAVTMPLNLYPSEFAHNAHWNYVGNPYPCYYDISYLNTTAPIYVPGINSGSCKVYRPGVNTCVLPPGQGFFIQRQADPSAVTSDTDALLVFDPAGRQTTGGPRAAASAPRIPEGMESPFLSHTYALSLTSAADPTMTDLTYIVTDRDASVAYEPQRDAVKFEAPLQLPPLGGGLGASAASDGPTTAPSRSLSLATLSDGVAYAINTRPASSLTGEEAPLWLSISAPAEGDYTLALAEGSLVVDDLVEGTTVTITPEAPYTFHAAAGTVADRFRVSITPGRFTEGVDAFSIIVPTGGMLAEEFKTYLGDVPYADVKCLTITGELNTKDYTFITTNLKSLVELDIQGTSCTDGKESVVKLSGLTKLEYVLLPAELTSLSDAVLNGCSALLAIDVPAKVKTIGAKAFDACSKLARVGLPDGLETIGNYAFRDCKALTSIEMPNSITSLGTYCFSNCVALTDIKFSTSLTVIPNYAFHGCSALKSVDIPEGVFEICIHSFSKCSALIDLTLPSTLGVIGPYAFAENTQAVTVRSHAVLAPFVSSDDFFRATNGSACAPYLVKLIVPEKGLSSYLGNSSYARLGSITTFEASEPDALPETATLVNVCGRHVVDFTKDDFSDFRPHLNLYHPDLVTVVAYDCDYANVGHQTIKTSFTVTRNSVFHAGNVAMNFYGQYPDATGDVWNTIVPHGAFFAESSEFHFMPYGGQWNFFTPMADVPMANIKPETSTNKWTVYAYDSQKRAEGNFSEAWRRVGADEVLRAGQGYIFRCSLTDAKQRNFNFESAAGFGFNGGQPYTLPLTAYPAANPDNAHWNFLGNPYPCFYDTRFLGSTSPVTVWNPVKQRYEAYSPIDDSYILYPGQAFFMQATDHVAAADGDLPPVVDKDRDASLIFDTDGTQACPCVRSVPATSRQRAAALMERRLCNVTLTGSFASAADDDQEATADERTDFTRVVFNNSAQMGYETQWDAAKFPAMEADAMEIYTLHDGIRYAINERPDADFTVELGLHSGADAMLTIALAPGTLGHAQLLDRLTGKTITLCAEEGREATYTFRAQAGTTEGRFCLTFFPDGETDGIEDLTDDATWTCPHGNSFDMLGRPLPSSSHPSSGVTIDAEGHKHIHQ